MDKNKKIDRKVESLFEHERSEMNLDHRWAKFEELLEEENRKPFFMFWCWGLLLLFIGILWGYNFYPNTTQKHVESKTDIDNYIELKKEVIEGNSTKKAIKEKNTDGSPFAILKNTKTAKRIAQIKNVNKNSIKTVKQDFKKESATQGKEISDDITLSTPHKFKSDLPATENSYESSSHFKRTTDLSKVEKYLPRKQSLSETISIDKISERQLLTTSKLFTLKPFEIYGYTETLNNPMISFPKDSKVKRNKVSVSIGSGFFTYKQGFNFGDSPDLLLIEDKSNLTSLESFNHTIKFAIPVSEKLAVNVGLDRMIANERFNYSESSTFSFDTTYVQRLIYHEQNDSTAVEMGTLTFQGQRNRDVQHFNKYKVWSFPVGVSYEFYKNKNLAVNVNSGLFINFNSSKTGRESVSGVVNINPEILDYKSSFNLDAYLGIQFEYSVNDKVGIFINPTVRQSVTNWSSQALVSHNPTFYGTYFGVKYKFIK